MAGHSHWANIARKKGRMDKKKGSLFGKLSRAIIVAARHGGDPALNLALRYAIDKARKSSMPKDNIDRAVRKGCGEGGGEDFAEITYEGYAPHGVAVLCDALTENRNRTGGDVRRLFETHGGNLGATGCVGWMFERKGVFLLPAADTSEERLFEIALEAGADDVTQTEGHFQITCSVEVFQKLAEVLEQQGLTPDSAEFSRIPSNLVELDLEQARQVLKLLDALEEHEDIQAVTANFSIPENVMAVLALEE
jgi:YebC/PmpR family DNA-binding regulatory protein